MSSSLAVTLEDGSLDAAVDPQYDEWDRRSREELKVTSLVVLYAPDYN